MSNRTMENMLVISLVGIILCLVFPFVQSIIYKVQKSSIESSVYSTIDSVELLYVRECSKGSELPFTVVFSTDGYKAYIGSTLVNSDSMIKKGRVATGGRVVVNPDSSVSVVGLKYDNFTCSKPSNGNVSCENS